MASSRPAARGRVSPAAAASAALLVLLLLLSAGCASRPPRIVPPAAGVEAVEGYGSAAIAGAEASIKGKFGFVFREPGLGRVEAFDPLGRTVFVIYFREGRAWFVLPGRKVYAEDDAAAMMERFLGIALDPDETIGLLAGTGPGADTTTGAGGWALDRDDSGRVRGGARGDYAFTVRAYFPGGAAPREIGLVGPGASGRVKLLKLNFDPAPREGMFDTGFLRSFTPKTWAELREMLER